MLTDGEGQLFEQKSVDLRTGKKLNVTLKPNGGFVMVLN